MGRVHQPGHEDGQEREHQDGVEAGRDRTRRGLGEGCPRWRTPTGAVPVQGRRGGHCTDGAGPTRAGRRRTREPVQSVGFHSGVRPRHRLGARCARSADLHAGRALALAQRTSRRLPQIRNTVGVSSATPRNAGRGQRRTTATAPLEAGQIREKQRDHQRRLGCDTPGRLAIVAAMVFLASARAVKADALPGQTQTLNARALAQAVLEVRLDVAGHQ